MRSRPLNFALGLAISLGALALSLRGVGARALWAQLELANYWFLLLHLGVLLAMQLVRSVRWGLLIAPLTKLSLRRVVAICAVGFMAMVLLPLRLGELARPYLVREPGRVSGSAAVVSIVIERVVDALVVAIGVVALLLGLDGEGHPVEWVRRSGAVVIAVSLGLVVALALLFRRREEVARLAEESLARLLPRLGRRLGGGIASFAKGLASLPSVPQSVGALLLTALYWGLNTVATWILGLGFGIHLAPTQALLCVGIRALGVIVPAGPGMLGTFQAFNQLGLSIAVPGLEPARAAAFSNVLWACQIAQVVATGLVFLRSSALTQGRPAVTLAELSHAGELLEGP